MSEIIEFPKDKIVRGIDVLQNSIRELQEEHISEVIQFIIPKLMKYLSVAGFDITENLNVKEAAFMVEAIKSSMYSYYGIEHPFQTLAEKVFNDIGDDNLEIVTKLDVDLEEKTVDNSNA